MTNYSGSIKQRKPQVIQLYPHQQRDADALRIAFRTYRAVCYQLATGGGKTIIAGWLSQQMRERTLKILVLVHRRELIGQFHRTLKLAGLAADVGVVCPGWPASPWAPIKLAMVFSWARRNIEFDPDFIIVDEAHHVRAETWLKVLAGYPNARVLGMTATPKRLDGKPLNPPFEHLHCGPTSAELCAGGYLAPVHVKRVPSSFRSKGLHRRRGDFVTGELDARADEKFVGDCVTAYLKYLLGERTIIFCVSRRHARRTAERLREEGVAAAYVGSDTPQRQRDATFGAFASGGLEAVANVALVDEGFDVPDCTAVMDTAATLSVTRFLQRIGRGRRPGDGKVMTYADLVGNTYRPGLGLPDADRYWTIDGDEPNGEPTKREPKGDDLRCCTSCLTVFDPRHAFCPHCGAEHDGRPVREVDVELVEATGGAPPKEKPPPRMTSAERNALLADCRRLVARGEPGQAWAQLRATPSLIGGLGGSPEYSADLLQYL
ncbi:MAG: DEAD/DEAH box helicase, partial [Thiotrichales bacterium]|nr:DEAD/DEAH box helicase [Thiotrichales bacterium]